MKNSFLQADICITELLKVVIDIKRSVRSADVVNRLDNIEGRLRSHRYDATEQFWDDLRKSVSITDASIVSRIADHSDKFAAFETKHFIMQLDPESKAEHIEVTVSMVYVCY